MLLRTLFVAIALLVTTSAAFAQELVKVTITSFPTGAEVKIDGKEAGETTLETELSAGTHEVTVSYAGFKSVQQTINVEAGEDNVFDFVLQETPKITIWNIRGTLYIDGVETPYDLGTSSYILEGNVGDVHEIKVVPVSKTYRPFSQRLTIQQKASSINISYKKNMQHKNEFYVEAGGMFSQGPGIAASVGANFGLLNIEAGYAHVWFDSNGYFLIKNGAFNYYNNSLDDYPCHMIHGKIGVNINAGSRMKITPQIGLRHVMTVVGINYDSPGEFSTHCTNGTIGVRCYFSILRNFGISLNPSYAFAIKQGDLLKQAADAGTNYKGLRNGFDIRLSLVANF